MASAQKHQREQTPERAPPLHRIVILATRPNTLSLSLTPVVIGTALLAQAGPLVEVGPSLRFWVFACLIQIGTNLHNDYADFVKGADTSERVGQARATQKGWLTARQTATAAMSALAGACAIGWSLSARPGCKGAMGWVTATSTFNAVAYTGGPFPLGYVGLGWISIGYSGLGEIFVMLYFGYVATLAPLFLQRPWHLFDEAPPLDALVAATALGFLATGVIVVNNLRDRKTDAKVDKRTTAVRFGDTFARAEYVALVVSL